MLRRRRARDVEAATRPGCQGSIGGSAVRNALRVVAGAELVARRVHSHGGKVALKGVLHRVVCRYIRGALDCAGHDGADGQRED